MTRIQPTRHACLFAAVLCAHGAQAQVTEVNLRDSALVATRQARLADIADIKGASSAALGQVLVCLLTRPNQPVSVSAAAIARLVERQQPGLAGRYAMQGASRVSITYAGSLAFDVMRNQAVVASAVAGAIAVEKPMLALADGQVGQSIRVRDPQTFALRTARVVAPGRVALQ